MSSSASVDVEDLNMNGVAFLPYKIFRNFHIPKGAKEEDFQIMMDRDPDPGEIQIVSFPKCGTTWIQHIVYLILNRGTPAQSVTEVLSAIPYPEQDGYPAGPFLALKSHLPSNLLRLSPEAKYIYIARNPKDACVSYYHFLKNLPGYDIESFDFFFDAFLSANIPHGDFAEHVMSWWNLRHQLNVLFLTYEHLWNEREAAILEVAEFLGHGDLDQHTLHNIVKYSSFEFMKNLSERDDSMKKYLNKSTGCTVLDDTAAKIPVMMRKGVIGDWRGCFSQKQCDLINNYLEENLQGTNLLEEWRFL